MKLRKVLAGAMAAAVAVSAMAVSASAEKMEEGVFIIGFGDADWKASFWGKDGDVLDSSYETTAKLEGNGTYTVVLDLSKGYNNVNWIDEDTGDFIDLTTGNSIGAMGIQIYGDYPTLGCDITSVKIDGKDMALQGVSFTNDEDGGRRTNIYNAWASFNADEHLTTDASKATSTLISIDDLGEWTKVEVTFDVYGLDEAADDAAADEDVAADDAADEDVAADDAADEDVAADDAADEDVDEAPADEAVEAPADEAPVAGDVDAAVDSTKGSPDTGVADVAAVAGLAIVAAGAVLVSKKRK